MAAHGWNRAALSRSPARDSPTTEDVVLGTGDYEGLQYTYHMEGVEHAYPWSISGTIEPGPRPMKAESDLETRRIAQRAP